MRHAALVDFIARSELGRGGFYAPLMKILLCQFNENFGMFLIRERVLLGKAMLLDGDHFSHLVVIF